MLKALSLVAASEAGIMLRKRMLVLVWYAAAAVMALIGLVFALVGLHSWLLWYVSVTAAYFIVAGVLFLAALIFVGIAAVVKRQANRRSALATAALVAAPAAARIASGRVGLTLAGAAGLALVGLMAGRRIMRD